jgi:hypothetical protein
MLDRGGRGFAAVNKVFEERTLVVGEGNGVLALPHEGNTQHIRILVLLYLWATNTRNTGKHLATSKDPTKSP